MKLGVAYSVFDGEELLEGSIKQIREVVDFIFVSAQSRSYNGEIYDGGMFKMGELFKNKTIDLWGIFESVSNPTEAETTKRTLCIAALRDAGCTHYLLLDCDEYFNTDEFLAAKLLIERNDLDGTACRFFPYYKDPTYQVTPIEEYYIPFIQKMYPDSRTGVTQYPVLADPTRMNNHTDDFYAFRQSELMMHHYSHIRADYMRKLNNSSSRFKWKEKIPMMLWQYENFKPGDEMPFYENSTVKIVPNYFNIQI